MDMGRQRLVIWWIGLVMGVGFLATGDIAAADDAVEDWVGRAVSVQGEVTAMRRGSSGWTAVAMGDTFHTGDRIRVGANSRAGIVLRNDTVVRLDQNTTLTFTAIERQKTFILKLLEGTVNFFSHRPRSLKILTPFVNGVVEGTEFLVQVDAHATRIDLFAGRITADNPHGRVDLVAGEGALATAGHPPRRTILLNPRDSVQWALYYPAVLVVGPENRPTALADVMALSRKGQPTAALAQMERVADGNRDAVFHVLRASLRLTVGRVRAAEDDIRQALARDPQNADAIALAAIIDVVQNRLQNGVDAAGEAVRLNSRAPGPRIALSYALQATFALGDALAAAQKAVDLAPDSDLAWARLAELRLSVRELNAGVRAARRAVDLNPHNARARMTLGFAYLTRIEVDKARDAFEQAIALDPVAPMPHLGLGLARIRDGDLAGGRAEIEIAVGLDPLNALMRSYLGKAYFDEKRDARAGKQFEIAESLDPKDPTPWFYDAIRKQTLNRPVEALRDLQHSIALNDNRAVYRSRLLLDQDLAARSAALGRIYNELSFESQAVQEGAKSLRTDPADFSAHRLLADIYAGRQRHEIARVSELLQSQLLQPLNHSPVQPQSAESSLIAPETTGTQWAAWNEFNPLFTRDRITFQAAGMVGSHSTWSDELSVAGLEGRYAYSIGQYHYETEGYRPNNDLEKDIADVFLQAALSPRTSLQVEYRQKSVDYGDLTLNFDPDDYSTSKRVSRKEKIPRLGLYHAVGTRHHFIGSLIYNRTEYSLYQENDGGEWFFGPILATEDRRETDHAYNAEGRYIYRGSELNLTAGAGYYRQKIDEDLSVTLSSGPISLYDEDASDESEARHGNAYTYARLNPLRNLDITLGFSVDALDRGDIDNDQLNPKFGVVWSPNRTLTFRGAAFRTLKRSLVTNQTIEPTQIAGFTQFFDDPFATDARRYGLGVDVKLMETLYWGAEATYSDLTRPIIDTVTNEPIDEDYEEYNHRVFLNWLAHPRLAISAEYVVDRYRQDESQREDIPNGLKTQTLPLTLTCFLPDGFQARVRGTWVNQWMAYTSASTSQTETERDDFMLVDLRIAYRLPDRLGMVGFEVTNLFNTDFNFQDTNFLTASEQDPVFKPVRQIVFKAALNF